MSSSATSQTVAVEMPKMGISVSEGTIVEWRKQPGDWIESDETIADVTTDKVDVEIPCPASGRVARILVEAGETVAVGTAIAEIDAAAKAGEAHPDEAVSSPEPVAAGDGEPDRSEFVSPVVARIAEKHGVDLSQVKGTGIGGRIRKKDVLTFVEDGEARPAPVLHTESPYKPDAPVVEDAPAAPAAERREPMTPMRVAIAKHMLESRRTSAHCTTVVEVDMSRVAARRAELKEGMGRRGVPLTYLAFVARATVEALQEFPILNASVDGEEIVLHDDVNLGIAVALESGLIVPVIPQAQRLSLEGLAAAIADVAERARSKRLDPDEVHGGTFTITNPGQFGAVLATPIINQPQVAILDLEAIVKRPVVISGPDGSESIAIRPMTYLPMSWDHRALDGAEAARFLSRVKERLEGWEAD
ncbi:MAG TPA: dihydrolipoamide acetyltransferase family protein [Solirubrobacterales bacterium]|nr:dihydrolipoamide acetyltransferase family protein [Solirubrobacterales bacterium]